MWKILLESLQKTIMMLGAHFPQIPVADMKTNAYRLPLVPRFMKDEEHHRDCERCERKSDLVPPASSLANHIIVQHFIPLRSIRRTGRVATGVPLIGGLETKIRNELAWKFGENESLLVRWWLVRENVCLPYFVFIVLLHSSRAPCKFWPSTKHDFRNHFDGIGRRNKQIDKFNTYDKKWIESTYFFNLFN